MKRSEMDPIILSSSNSSDVDFDSLEFRKVLCKGFLDESKSIFVGPRSRSISGVTENGYFMITLLMPLENVTDSVQSPVLVNRGWVPRSWRDKYINDLHVEGKILHEIPRDEEQKKRSWWLFWSKIQNMFRRRYLMLFQWKILVWSVEVKNHASFYLQMIQLLVSGFTSMFQR